MENIFERNAPIDMVDNNWSPYISRYINFDSLGKPYYHIVY